MKELKEEISKVRFELQLQISELQLKLQPTTPPKVREQCEATIKANMNTLEDAIKGCSQLFEKTMEMWTSLQEDPHLQKIEAYIEEKQVQFDEIRAKAWTLAPVQSFTRLRKGKFI